MLKLDFIVIYLDLALMTSHGRDGCIDGQPQRESHLINYISGLGCRQLAQHPPCGKRLLLPTQGLSI